MRLHNWLIINDRYWLNDSGFTIKSNNELVIIIILYLS